MRNLHELLQQTETLLNRGEVAEALGIIAQVKQRADDESPGESDLKATLPERIQHQLTAIYDVQALVSVTIDSIDPDKDFARHRVLHDVYGRLEDIAHEVDLIATDVRRAVSAISDALLVQS